MGSVVVGGSGSYFGSPVTTWSYRDTNGVTQDVGAFVPVSAFQNAANTASGSLTPDMESISVAFPSGMSGTTFFDHLTIDYEPTGHPPQPYQVPHFDLHFYGISQAEQQATDCSNLTSVSSDQLPPNYQAGNPGLPPNGDCVPQMGIHAADTTSPEFNGQPFTKTMILGYYAGKFRFDEPMVTVDQLLSRQSFQLNVPIPPRVDRATTYPTLFTAYYDPIHDGYWLVMSNFQSAGQ
jgi:hypothetical protein